MELASSLEYIPIIELLLKYGADINSTDSQSRTLLMLLNAHMSIRLMKFYLEHGADPNAKDKSGGTVLGWTCHTLIDRFEKMKFLLDYGADPNATNNSGQTVLLGLSIITSCPIVRMLINYGIDLNRKTNLGHTVLYKAASYGYKEIVDLLLEYRVDVTAKTNVGMTAYQITDSSDIKESLLNYEISNINNLTEWRPCNHPGYPRKYRQCMATLVILAKSTT